MLTKLTIKPSNQKLLPAPKSTAESPQSENPNPAIEQEVNDKFEESYFDGSVYQQRFCGENIRRFAAKLSENALESAKVLTIKNAGCSYFGFVRATQVREAGPDGSPKVRDRNWYYHVVMESEGSIYDFDHDIKPTVRKVDDYFDTMYFHDKDVPAQRKKDEYELEVFDAKDFLEKKKDSSNKVMLGDYLASAS